jgi:hypothetical protein
VSARHGQEGVVLDRTPVEGLDGDIGEREEVPLGGVEHV